MTPNTTQTKSKGVKLTKEQKEAIREVGRAIGVGAGISEILIGIIERSK